MRLHTSNTRFINRRIFSGISQQAVEYTAAMDTSGVRSHLGKKGLEPLTVRLSSVYSNQLSYLPLPQWGGLYRNNTWERQDSNLRRHRQQIYSLPPLTTQPLSHTPLHTACATGSAPVVGERRMFLNVPDVQSGIIQGTQCTPFAIAKSMEAHAYAAKP